MAFSLAQRLQALGVPQDMGLEVERQITTGTGSAFHFQLVGFPTIDAVNLADGITAGTVDPNLLTEGSIVPAVATEIAEAINAVPVNTVAPVLSGTPTVGQVLTVTNGTWTSKPGTPAYTRAWYRDAAVIAGQTGTTYTLVTDDVGANITARVVATNVNGASAPVSSNAVGPVVA